MDQLVTRNFHGNTKHDVENPIRDFSSSKEPTDGIPREATEERCGEYLDCDNYN